MSLGSLNNVRQWICGRPSFVLEHKGQRETAAYTRATSQLQRLKSAVLELMCRSCTVSSEAANLWREIRMLWCLISLSPSSFSHSPLAQHHESRGAPRDVPGSTLLIFLPASSTTWQNFIGWESGSLDLSTPIGRSIYQLLLTKSSPNEKSCQQKPSDGLSVCEYMDLLNSSCLPLYSNCTLAREGVKATWLRQASKPLGFNFL